MFTSTPGGQQQLYAFQVAYARREVNRGESLFGIGFEIRMRVDERLHHVRVTLRRGPHQRRLVLRRLFRVDRRAVLDQHTNRVHAAGLRASHQRSFAGGDRRCWDWRPISGVAAQTRHFRWCRLAIAASFGSRLRRSRPHRRRAADPLCPDRSNAPAKAAPSSRRWTGH